MLCSDAGCGGIADSPELRPLGPFSLGLQIPYCLKIFRPSFSVSPLHCPPVPIKQTMYPFVHENTCCPSVSALPHSREYNMADVYRLTKFLFLPFPVNEKFTESVVTDFH